MFFALPEFTTTDGKPVNATFGMAKFFVSQLVKENPDYIVFIKDAKWDNFRHELYSEYKATRERMPDNLRSQISDIELMVQKMWIDIIEKSGYEADDVIGTLAKKLGQEGNDEIYILSWDKDLYALVSEQVKIYDTQKKLISWPAETRKKFWVDAQYVTDYLAICGDSSDNIPWVAWIGPKKCEVLINEFWTVEDIYAIVEKVQSWEMSPQEFSPEAQKLFKWKTFEKIVEGRDNAFLSKKLATLDSNVDIWDFHLEDYAFVPEEITNPEVSDFFESLEFHSLVTSTKPKQWWDDIWKNVQIIGDKKWLESLEKKIEPVRDIVLDTETTSLSPQEAELVWVSLLLDEDNIFYINRLHTGPKSDDRDIMDFIQKLLDSDKKIIGHNLKYDLEILTLFLDWHNQTQKETSQSSLF